MAKEPAPPIYRRITNMQVGQGGDATVKPDAGESGPVEIAWSTRFRLMLFGFFCGPCTKAFVMLQTMFKIFWTRAQTSLIWDGKQWVAYSDFATYTTMLCNEQTHSQALAAVAKTGRFTLGQAMEPEFVKMALEHWRPHEILQAQRQQSTAFMVFMIQKLFNISIQASLVGISANLSVVNGNGAGADTLTVITVLVSCILGVGSVFTQYFSSTSMKDRVLRGVEKKLHVEGATKWQIHHEYVVARAARSSWMVTVLFSAGCLATLLWCTVKTVMAWYCECGTWNFRSAMIFPSSWGNHSLMGCVRFHNHPGSDGTGCSVSENYLRRNFHPETVNFINISDSFDCSWLL